MILNNFFLTKKKKQRHTNIYNKQFIACSRASETERDCKDNDEMEPLEEEKEEEEEEEEEEAFIYLFIYLFTCLVIRFSVNSVKTVVSITTEKVSYRLMQIHISFNSVRSVISTVTEKVFGIILKPVFLKFRENRNSHP